MNPLVDLEEYTEPGVAICPNGTRGLVEEIGGLVIMLPKRPSKDKILFHDLPREEQYWRRVEMPKELQRIKSMDEWMESPKEFRNRFRPYVEEEFRRRREGVWFYNCGVPTYITGRHYMALQWTRFDIGYPNFLEFQRKIFIHMAACEIDPRCIGQLYTKCRRSGYTNICSAVLLDEATQVKDKLLGIQSKTGKDAQENIFMKKVVQMFRHYPFFFKPIQDGTTNPRMELAFREPSKRITKNNKTTRSGDALNSIINWKNTTNNAYDGEKLHMLYMDECFAPGTKILTPVGFVSVDDINVGDEVVVDGGKRIKVAKTFSGEDEMYLVSQPYGKDYVVNSKHRLVLNNYFDGEVTLTPIEYLEKSRNWRRHTTRVMASPISSEKGSLNIPPYILGAWLGDGFSEGSSFIVCADDHELISEIESYSHSLGSDPSVHLIKNSQKAYRLYIPGMKSELSKLDLVNNKHIPKSYMSASLDQRLELLAGIIDTDGYLSPKNTYSIGMSRKDLIVQIYHLAKSCGLDVSEVREKTTNFDTNAYLVSITGDASIPCRLERKKSESRSNYKSRRGKMNVTPVGVGRYVGIQLETESDSERRLILEDYTVSMNCGKWEKPVDIRDAWRIERTCLIVGRKIIGTALLGSTVNPMDKGGAEYKELWQDSNPDQRNANGRTRSGLYRLFIPAYDALEGFFDVYGRAVVEDPEEPVIGIDGEYVEFGAKTFLKNERDSLKNDASELNEVVRQFPFTEDEAFRDSVDGSLFNVGQIYEQVEYNDDLFPNPVVRGNFIWKENKKDEEVVFSPDPKGRFYVSWLPPVETRNVKRRENSKLVPPYPAFGCGGVDSYDLDATLDGRGSKGALHLYNKFTMDEDRPSNMFVVEYASRPPLAKIFYEDVLMCAFFYGYPILIENNKYGIARYFEDRGYDGYLMGRPDHLKVPGSHSNVKTKGVPSNSQDVIHAHAQAIEAFIHEHVGMNRETGEMGKMYFNRTLEDWVGFKIDKRTKFDLTISAGLALLAAQKGKPEKPPTNFSEKRFFRRYKGISRV